MEEGAQIELRTPVSGAHAELLEGIFWEMPDCPWGLMQREPGDPFELFGYFPDADAGRRAYAELRERISELPEDPAETRIEDAEWQTAYKRYIRPWSERGLHWIPLWERPSTRPPSHAAVVYLDAGMAFGTGSHATTRLCARRLIDDREAHPNEIGRRRVVDAGCGSGVLALSAAALGYRRIDAFDNDPDAIAVCHANARENPGLALPSFRVAGLDDGLRASEADLVLANIQTNILLPGADSLVRAVAPGGTLVLSGVLADEADRVRERFQRAFAENGRPAPAFDTRREDAWTDLCFRRPAAPGEA